MWYYTHFCTQFCFLYGAENGLEKFCTHSSTWCSVFHKRLLSIQFPILLFSTMFTISIKIHCLNFENGIQLSYLRHTLLQTWGHVKSKSVHTGCFKLCYHIECSVTYDFLFILTANTILSPWNSTFLGRIFFVSSNF